MSSLLRGFSLLLLPLCGWLAGDAVQAKTTLHLAALQRTITLLQRIRQEIQYRRADLQSLYRQLCREGVLAQTHDGTLQQLPAPGQLSATERACFTECFGGLGRAEAAPSAFPNSTLAMAVVHKRRTLKIISKLMVGMASSPRLTLRIGTPNCTLLPKIAAMPKMVLPVLSNPKKRPAVRPKQ